MPMLVIALAALGGLVLVAALIFTRSPPRARASGGWRRSGTRHAGAANAVETQLRRIAAQRATPLDETFHRLIPNPELLRRRIEQTGRSWTLGQYAMTCAGLMLVTWVLLAVRARRCC